MKKKVLYIDPYSFPAHANFNNIQISAIERAGYDVDVVARRGAGISKALLYEIPDRLYKEGSALKFHVSQLRVQRHIYRKVNKIARNYHAVVFSAYDTLTLWLMPRLRHNRVYLFNHDNLDHVRNGKKRMFFNRIPDSYTHLILNKDFAQAFDNILPAARFRTVPHGLVEKSALDSSDTFPDFITEGMKYFVCPSSSSSDPGFIDSLMRSPELSAYLDSINARIVVRGDYRTDNPAFISYTQRLSDDEYRTLLNRARGIILIYSEDYMYRVSAVMLECFVMNRPCMVKDAPCFRAFESYFNYNPFFNKDVKQFIAALRGFVESTENMDLFYKDISDLDPESSWRKILN